MGVDRSTYSYYELGKIKPDIQTILSIANIFRVHYTFILESEKNAVTLSDNSAGTKQTAHSANSVSAEDLSTLSRSERDFLLTFRLLPKDAQKDAQEYVYKKFKEQKKSKN